MQREARRSLILGVWFAAVVTRVLAQDPPFRLVPRRAAESQPVAIPAAPLPPALRPATGALDQQAALAEFHLRRNDLAKAAVHIAAMERLDPRHESEALEGVLWECCTAARQRRDWPALLAAARRYLELRSAPHAEDARLLLGIATFETAGTLSAELQEHIEERLAMLAATSPGRSLADRVGRVLGQGTPPNPTAVRVWVNRCNGAMQELTEVGGAAAPGLRAMLLRPGEGARRAAVVLSRLRLPETTPWLIARLADPATPAWARTQLVRCLGMHEEERCLPTLLACFAPGNPAAVRAAAADGIKQTVGRTEGTTRQDIADAMAVALESNDFELRAEVLQALFEVHAPIPLDPLLDLLSDRRPLGWDDHRICDNALWILLRQLGMQLERADGTFCGDRCTPEIAAWLRGWHGEVQGRLRWDAEARHYRVTDR